MDERERGLKPRGHAATGWTRTFVPTGHLYQPSAALTVRAGLYGKGFSGVGYTPAPIRPSRRRIPAAMPESDSFVELMARLRAGDEAAAARIFHAFSRRLIALARNHLDTLVRQKLDPEDVVQSVFKSFFARHGDGAYQLEDWNSLWSLLARITLRKCGHRIERFHAARRDIRRETAGRGPEDRSAATWEPLARDPTPSEAAVLVETVETLARELGERDRRILMLSLQGCPIPEVSAQVGCTERTVYRVLGYLKERLDEMRTGAAEG
jgi:RNA polymerase sigma-70 factor, ECF subfamily